ncbi:pyocin knob domain-containing protein [uncultured Gemmobacter sp.]|uniref:pyocin knob domain-containing protein n=1 Tax=uncultured Gemmobacter sp. TaxID=1095917 RepID=UPI002595EC04|nr:pyocin knob domain-containing protein [uncultured Gemmobacter sp.]
MPDLPVSYATGTVTLGAGSTTVTGSGTSWIAAGLEAGDMFWAAGLSVRIASVNSATSLTLAFPWPGAALSGANYEVRFTPDATRVLSAAREVLSALTNGNLSSLAGLTTSANKLAYYTGAGTAALATLSAFARTLLDDADQAAMRATLGLVPTGSATDTTAGRLVRTGDYGLGTAISLGATDNLDALLVSGFFYNPTAGNTAGNNYPPGISGAGALIVVARSSTNVIQKFISYGGTSTASGLREFTRSWGTSGWGPWVEQFHQGSLLGTVSQSGGVPTGKVIERGSNANGEYVRFADGTQICTAIAAGVDAATAAGPIYMRSNLLTWTFPASFLSAPVVAGGGGNAARWLGINAPSVGNVQYRVFSYASSGTLSMPGLIATGRWF